MYKTVTIFNEKILVNKDENRLNGLDDKLTSVLVTLALLDYSIISTVRNYNDNYTKVFFSILKDGFRRYSITFTLNEHKNITYSDFINFVSYNAPQNFTKEIDKPIYLLQKELEKNIN